MRYAIAVSFLVTFGLSLRFVVHASVVDDDVPEWGSLPRDRFHAAPLVVRDAGVSCD